VHQGQGKKMCTRAAADTHHAKEMDLY